MRKEIYFMRRGTLEGKFRNTPGVSAASGPRQGWVRPPGQGAPVHLGEGGPFRSAPPHPRPHSSYQELLGDSPGREPVHFTLHTP